MADLIDYETEDQLRAELSNVAADMLYGNGALARLGPEKRAQILMNALIQVWQEFGPALYGEAEAQQRFAAAFDQAAGSLLPNPEVVARKRRRLSAVKS